jgi:hypothetical protein
MFNRIVPVLALTGLVAATACERREETVIETPATEAPVTAPAPTVEPAPVTPDTPLVDPTWEDEETLPQDTL